MFILYICIMSKKKEISDHKKKYLAYINSKEWLDIRIEIHHSRGGKCERCGSTHILQVHHVTYKNLFNEEPEDLELLCSGCHRAEHKINKKGKKKNKQNIRKLRKPSFQQKCKMLESARGRKRLKQLGYNLK